VSEDSICRCGGLEGEDEDEECGHLGKRAREMMEVVRGQTLVHYIFILIVFFS
jgi:hypothetical protein